MEPDEWRGYAAETRAEVQRLARDLPVPALREAYADGLPDPKRLDEGAGAATLGELQVWDRGGRERFVERVAGDRAELLAADDGSPAAREALWGFDLCVARSAGEMKDIPRAVVWQVEERSLEIGAEREKAAEQRTELGLGRERGLELDLSDEMEL